jgi:hypothetical protein
LERSLKTYRSEGDLELQMKSNHNSEGELYRCEKNSENLPHQSPPLNSQFPRISISQKCFISQSKKEHVKTIF